MPSLSSLTGSYDRNHGATVYRLAAHCEIIDFTEGVICSSFSIECTDVWVLIRVSNDLTFASLLSVHYTTYGQSVVIMHNSLLATVTQWIIVIIVPCIWLGQYPKSNFMCKTGQNGVIIEY